jgi:hypothetical protein
MYFIGTCNSCGCGLGKKANEVNIVRKVIGIDEESNTERVMVSSHWNREVCDKCRDKILSDTNTYRSTEKVEIDEDAGVNTTKC